MSMRCSGPTECKLDIVLIPGLRFDGNACVGQAWRGEGNGVWTKISCGDGRSPKAPFLNSISLSFLTAGVVGIYENLRCSTVHRWRLRSAADHAAACPPPTSNRADRASGPRARVLGTVRNRAFGLSLLRGRKRQRASAIRFVSTK